jgi:CrcB protein
LRSDPCGERSGAAQAACRVTLLTWENAAMSYLLVFFGGGLGATLRHLVNVTCARTLGTGFPWGTFIINITGSTAMGLIAGYLAFKGEASQPWRLFLMTGILGGYTTFSAYSLDAALLYERGELGLAALYVVGSVVLSIAGLFAGLALVRQFT